MTAHTTPVPPDPAHQRARQAVLTARAALATACTELLAAGYLQIRVDQYQHPDTRILVETGYMYGETRLAVHTPGGVVADFRLTGYGTHAQQFDRFRELTAA